MEEKNRNKAAIILNFFCAAGWLVCLIFDIVEKDFSFLFYMHILLIVCSLINGFVFLKKKLPSEKNDNLDDKNNN